MQAQEIREKHIICSAAWVISCKLYGVGLVLALAALLSAWTCTAVVNHDNCRGAIPYPQIGALSPNPLSADVVASVLTVEGSGFDPQSEIQWNDNPLPTTFIDSRHLQTTVTQETFDSYGGSAGNNVLITVMSPGTTSVSRCPNGGNSSSLILEID
jgi:hypothetical protein